MGLCSRYKSLTCNSCSMHCQIMPEESPRLQYCANSCFCMWPEESSYFNRGVVEGILTKNHNARLSGYIFVDFSVSFLRLFLEKDWIDYLASTDMGIVLVAEINGCHFNVTEDTIDGLKEFDKYKTRILDSGINCKKHPWLYFPLAKSSPGMIVMACNKNYNQHEVANCLTLSYR
ncbi:hypothetical protein NX037_23240, partial [Escherichia coli]|nr:hypothetical protein [Escherichia coli]